MTQTDTQEPEITRAEAARRWARTYLTEHGGEACAQELYRAGAAAGFPTSTLQAARKASEDILTVKEGKTWVWRLTNEEELAAVAAAHATAPDVIEERRRDRTQPFRTMVTSWPCRGLTRVITETRDPHAPGGVVRRTSWVHSTPTNCKIPTLEGEAK
jgi:hypothetical protein|nr:MAG TPA: hypothetical protein [Bacteriophage sp.]